MNLGYKIRKMRELRGYKQEYMADSLGITQNSYGKIESGETKLSVERLKKIAEILGTGVETIKNFDENIVFNINHQQGGNAGYITIHNTFDEILKTFEVLTEPFKGQISQMREEITFLRNLIDKGK